MQLQTSEPLYQIMLARYYGSGVARFLSKDPRPGARRIVDPQGWNAYTYCLGNPLKYFDPDGNDIVFAPGQKPGFIDRMTNAIAQASRNSGAASDIQNADASSVTVVLKEGRLPVSKDKAKNTIDVGLGFQMKYPSMHGRPVIRNARWWLLKNPSPETAVPSPDTPNALWNVQPVTLAPCASA